MIWFLGWATFMFLTLGFVALGPIAPTPARLAARGRPAAASAARAARQTAATTTAVLALALALEASAGAAQPQGWVLSPEPPAAATHQAPLAWFSQDDTYASGLSFGASHLQPDGWLL